MCDLNSYTRTQHKRNEKIKCMDLNVMTDGGGILGRGDLHSSAAAHDTHDSHSYIIASMSHDTII